MPNYEDLGFQINVDGADSAVSRLDKIIERLDKLENASLSVQKSQIALSNAQLSLNNSQKTYENALRSLTNAENARKNAIIAVENAEARLEAIRQNKKATATQLLLAENNLLTAQNSLNSATNTELNAQENVSKALNNVEKSTNAVVKAELNLKNAKEKSKQATDKKIDSQKKEENQTKRNTKALSSYITKLTSVVVLARKFAHFMNGSIQESAKYIENLNLFAVAYGETYQQQLDWALGIAEAYGLANNEVIKFAGTFRELSTSLGLVGETADLVSKTVTNLGYDLSALFNTTVEQAMEKLQSGVFSGNVRPLRAYGIDISQNQIDALFETNEALRQLGVNARNLSQSDKVLARLIITLQSGKDSFGTMAREINNLQSQFRIFQGSLANFKLAIGDLFNKPLAEAMVYLNGFIIGITNVIRAFVPLQKEDTTPKTITNITTSSEEANEELDKLQGKLAGFDKFNVLQQGGGSSSNLAVTEALNKLLEEQATLYQSQLGDLTDINNKATQIATSVESFFKPLLPYLEFVSNTVKDIVNLIYPIVENVLVKLKPLLEPLVKIWGDVYKLIDNILVLLSPIINMVLDLLNISTPLLEIVHSITWVISTALSGALYGIIGILTPILFVFETIFKVVESIAEIVRSLFQWDWNSLGKNLSNIWKTWRVGELTNALANFNPTPKFANGGYTNANLIMTHENGKREWVGKAAGSSAIVNDTQMSDIMEGAVAKGVFNAMRANSAMGSTTPTNENIIIKIGEEEVFRAVRKTAKRKGVDFASV